MGLFGKSKLEKENESLRTQLQESRSAFLGYIQNAIAGTGDVNSLSMWSGLKSSAVWACVRILSRAVASLPCNIFEIRQDLSKIPAPQKNLQYLLCCRPNPVMTAFTFFSTIMIHLLLRGNAFLWLKRDEYLRLQYIYPLYPDRVTLQVLPDGSKRFLIFGEFYDSTEVLHIPGISLDGFSGVSVLSLLQDIIKRDVLIGDYSKAFFENGAYPGGVIEVDKQLSDKAYDRLKTSFEARHQGAGKAHRMAILEESAKYKAVTISARDAQLIETKEASVEDIARIFGVPLHMVHAATKASYSSNEQQSLEFLVHTLRPWIISIEQSFNTGLFSLVDQGRFECRFDVNSLLRADIAARMAAYQLGRNIGLYSINEIRAFEGLNPIEGGDEHNLMIQGAPTPTASAGGDKKPQSEPDPKSSDDSGEDTAEEPDEN